MTQKDENDVETPATPSGALGELIEDKLNRPAAEETAEELEEEPESPGRSGATDYARGTTEHDDDREA